MTVFQLITKFSVRTRIVLLAVIPVAGFLANGVAFMIGEDEVSAAFESAKRASTVADAGQQFKDALADMRISARDFASKPGEDRIKDFESAYQRALDSLEQIDKSVDSQQSEIVALTDRLSVIKKNFDGLVAEQRKLGFSDEDGLRRAMRDSAISVERIINEDMSWLRETDAQRLMVSLVVMRRFETEYRLNRSQISAQLFFDEVKNFNKLLGDIIGAAVLKDQLGDQVKAYAKIFSEWSRCVSVIIPNTALIDLDTRNLMPAATALIASTRQGEAKAGAALAYSQLRTKIVISVVGVAAVLIGLGLSWLIGRSITRPLHGLVSVMKRLASGDTSAKIPQTRASDEIGHGTQRGGVPRQHHRARKAVRHAGQGQQRARAAQRIDRDDDRPVRALDRPGAGEAARRRESAGDDFERTQQCRRCGLGGGDHGGKPRQRGLGERHRGGKLGGRDRFVDRRNRRPGGQVDGSGDARGLGGAAHDRHDARA